jgi:glycosyltransferase involved in cell wall biosynthesis
MWRDGRTAMTVSVVIPCFNHARFLPLAIDSALAQSWPACEVVVVDDGSTDGSSAVAARFAAVTLMRQENRGLSAARNAGLAASHGDIVIFLDADDRLAPGAARAAAETFGAHPTAAMVFGRCELIDENDRPLATNLPSLRSCYYEQLLRANHIWTPAMAAFRRQTLDTVGPFDPRVNAAADYDLYLRITRRFPVASHDAVVAYYRHHSANMSLDPVLMLDATLTVLRNQHPHVTGDDWLTKAHRSGLARARAFYGERLVERFRGAVGARRHRAALGDALHLLRLYPAGAARLLLKNLILSLRGPRDTGGRDRLSDLASLQLTGQSVAKLHGDRRADQRLCERLTPLLVHPEAGDLQHRTEA